MAAESCLWIYTVLGFGHKHLNKPSAALSYLSQAAYPIYIIHMMFIYLGSSVLFKLDINPWIKLVGITLFTFFGCFIVYEFIVRRFNLLRPLFGLKLKNSKSRLELNQPERKFIEGH